MFAVGSYWNVSGWKNKCNLKLYKNTLIRKNIFLCLFQGIEILAKSEEINQELGNCYAPKIGAVSLLTDVSVYAYVSNTLK